MNIQWQRVKCESNTCVEIATDGPTVLLRSSDHRDGIATMSRDEWHEFVAAIKRREFDAL